MPRPCPFCDVPADQLIWSNSLVVAIRDGYPVTKGHTLIIPRRHVPTWFDASPWEQQAIWEAVGAVKRDLDATLHPDGYNIGFNAGEAAGQTVMHLHVHVIPRYRGDMDDPRGGVRGVIPSKQKYATAAPSAPPADPFVALDAFVPGQEDAPFWPVLRQAMRAAEEIDLVSAFVQRSGLDVLEGDLLDALDRGAAVRVLTGDYLGVTHPHALQRLFTLTTEHSNLDARLYRVGPNEVFHPKAYIFVRAPHGVAFVGSSNLSRSALHEGVEWNLKTTHADAATFAAIRGRFRQLFDSPSAQDLTASLVANYQGRVRVPPAPEPAPLRPKPRDLQKEVLAKLQATRVEGNRRGLVVMATGLGKTYLSAFDFEQHGGKRALFVAHREEILRQAADTWAAVHPDRSIGYLTGAVKAQDADLLFASIQTLSQVHHLRTFDPSHFDYIVIDEFHHAAAASYRKLLAWFEPRFLLGLTATPDRMDGAALLDLCNDNVVVRIGLVEGIKRKQLVPFRYFGVRDGIDFETIPWRSGRFDIAALTRAAATRDRAAQALREYKRHAPEVRRALVFCCSQAHADFIAGYFREYDVAAAAVHSGPTSAPRAESLEKLRAGDLEAIVAVDVFNEGVDLPDVNTILMLRPTESPVIFLQQLGRGLRPGVTVEKPALTVVDFIGNHRSFLVKPQALLALLGRDVAPGDALRRLRIGLKDLPPGCSVDIDTAALDILERVARLSKQDQLLYTYHQLRDSLGRRPTARELYAAGALMKPVLQRYGTWFDFVAAQGDLTDDEGRVLERHRDWLMDLMKTGMTRSYKMVALEVLDDLDHLHDEIGVLDLSRACRSYMLRHPLLRLELQEHTDETDAEFAAHWREMPLRIFDAAKGFSHQWFELDGDEFRSLLDVAPEDCEIFDAMTAELVGWRLRKHIDRRLRYASGVLDYTAPIELVVSHSGGNPILRFDRARRPDLPSGDVPVEVDGDVYTFRFVKIAVNVATDVAGGPNRLPALMRSWFGPTAGQPGTRHRVELVRKSDDAWSLRKRAELTTAGTVIPLGQVPFYRELAVACGVAAGQVEGHDVSEPLAVETDRTLDAKRHFVVRAYGESMDGGVLPIRDGDLVLCEWATVTDPAEVEGKVVLLTGGSGDEVLAAIKVPRRIQGRWVLHSTNPAYADQPVDPAVTLRVAGRVLEVVQERTGPVLWGQYDRNAIARLFGYENNPSWRSGHRDVEVGGKPHTVLMVNLRKPAGTPIEQRYADRFLAPDEFQWESQASTTVRSAKGQRILGHAEEGRTIHLFVRYHTKTVDGTGEPFTYCGTLHALRHEGEKPIRVWFQLDHPLPRALWQAWEDLH